MITNNDIRHRLTNQSPASRETEAALDTITGACIALGDILVELVPPGREQSLAVTKLEEVSAWAKKGICLNQR